MVKGFTCSSFDLLHPGHLIMLKECKENCDYLIVGLQVDPTIDRPDTKQKPVQTVTERYTQLEACKYVDEIVYYETERDLENLLASLDINIRFIGEEYRNIEYTGKEICQKRGIEIFFNKERLYDYSSSELKERIIDTFKDTLYANPYESYLFYLGNFARRAKPGLFLEFGVWHGRSMKVLAKNTANKVYGFDSFKGLPDNWQGDFFKGFLACDIPTDLPKNTELVIGYIEDTLDNFLATHEGPITFIHIDVDIYSATKYLLEKCHERIADGCIICFDDFINYTGYEDHEYKAWSEYVKNYNVTYGVFGVYGAHQYAVQIIKEQK